MTRVVLGLPSYNGGSHTETAIASLRAQTHRDFLLVCCDDGSTDGTAELLERHAAEDERLHVERAATRHGMVGNWVRAFRVARERCPDMRYFAWVSDHDVWDPRWLELLLAELEAHPEAVLAHPLGVGIRDDGRPFRKPKPFDTAGVSSSWERVTSASRSMKAGNLVYGLFRADALERCGVFRRVIVPDRLLLTEMAMLGEFRQVDEVLWWRRFGERTMGIRQRQRQTLFGERTPVHARIPYPFVHGAVLLARVVTPGSTRPETGRMTALALTVWYTGYMTREVIDGWRRGRRKRRQRKRAAA